MYQSGLQPFLEKKPSICLLQLYDALEEGVQEEIRTRSGKEAAWATYVLEELRQRFSRLVRSS